jgi:hypothetical protein
LRLAALVGWTFLALLAGSMPMHAETRVALVIGNSAYQNVSALPNPVNDANDITSSLRRLGFDVKTLTNAKFDDIRNALVDFGQRARGVDVALIFFAGHGIQMGGENWLIPIDARLITDLNVPNETIGLQSLARAVSNTTKVGLVILDACRSNPFLPKMQSTNVSRAVERGFSRVEPSDNVLIAYAARDGTTATDGAGRNSPFTQSLLKNIETPGLEISFLFRKVRDDVMRETKREQQPFVYGSLSTESIYLKAPNPPADTADVLWDAIKESKVPAVFEEFLSRYPNSVRAAAARSRLADLTAQRVPPANKADGSSATAALQPAKPNDTSGALNASLLGTRFIAEETPFICDKCRSELRAALKKPRRHSAVAISLDGGYYSSNGADSENEARGFVLGSCLGARRLDCIVYEVDGKIVWDEPQPMLPPKPWIHRDAQVESPLDFQKIPGLYESDRPRLTEIKKKMPKMAFALGTLGQWSIANTGETDEENARIALEQCSFSAHSSCQIVAVNDSLLMPLGQEISFTPAVLKTRLQTGPAFDPGQIPFVSDQGRARIRDGLANQPQHTALVISFSGGYWWSLYRKTAEEARTVALGQCLASIPLMCFVYAIDGQVVWNEQQPVLPPRPWFVRDPKSEKPLVADKVMAHFNLASKQYVRDRYAPAAEPKAIASEPRNWSTAYSGTGEIKSEDEAARLALERCNFIGRAPCRVIAVNNTAITQVGSGR